MTFMDQCVGTNDTVRMREEMVSPRKEKEHTTMASRKGPSGGAADTSISGGAPVRSTSTHSLAASSTGACASLRLRRES